MSPNKPARKIAALTLLACGLILPFGSATATAQSPARDGYDGTNVISALPVLGERGTGERGTGALPPQRGVTRDTGANGTVGGTLGVDTAGDPPAAVPTRRESGAPSGSGSLPFTGFEGGLLGLMGLALLVTGFALRRAGSARR